MSHLRGWLDPRTARSKSGGSFQLAMAKKRNLEAYGTFRNRSVIDLAVLSSNVKDFWIVARFFAYLKTIPSAPRRTTAGFSLNAITVK